MNALLRILSYTLLCATFSSQLSAATINIITTDQIGEGFNDPSPFTPHGGNSARTLGQARLNALHYATSIIEKTLPYSAEITIQASMDSLGGTASSAPLANAGAKNMVFNFSNAPKLNTLYPIALANYIFGQDIHPNTADIDVYINSDIDLADVLQNSQWYYGLDANPPRNHPDLVTVLTHELLHGLGFSNNVNLATGELPFSKDDIYSNRLSIETDNLHIFYTDATDAQRAASHVSHDTLVWNGQKTNAAGLSRLSSGMKNLQIKMYTPAPLAHTSSVSHFDTSLFPDEQMEPFYTGPNHSLGLAAHVLSDIGWGNLADLGIFAERIPETESLESQQNFRITVTNSGYESAATVMISLPLNNITVKGYQSEYGDCSVVNDNYRCELGDIHTGGQKTIYLAISNTTIEDRNLAFSVAASNIDPKISNNLSYAILRSPISANQLTLAANISGPNHAGGGILDTICLLLLTGLLMAHQIAHQARKLKI